MRRRAALETVGLLTTSYPRFDGDPAGSFVDGYARCLATAGLRVEVLAPEPRDGRPTPARGGPEVRWVPYIRPRGALARTFYGAGVPDNVRVDPRAWPGLLTFPLAQWTAALRRVGRWDAIVSHWALPSGLVAGAVRGRRSHLAVLHGADVHLLRRLPIRRAVLRRLAAGADRLQLVSDAARDELCGWLPGPEGEALRARTFVQPMGFDPLPPGPSRAEARRMLGAARFVVLALGRLVPIKGLDVLVDAARGLPLEVWIAGDGPRRGALEEQARRLGVRARFFGAVAGSRKHALLRAADALAIPSRPTPSGRTEGLPVVALEGADAGLPLVVSASGGLPRLFRHERAALVVPPGDAGALRAALERLRTDPALRRGVSGAAARVAAEHRWSSVAPRLLAALEPSALAPAGSMPHDRRTPRWRGEAG
ncbi:MAG: glycosyltransferase [Sandaracinaceae bacterium]